MDEYDLAAMMDALGDDRRDFIASVDEGGRRRDFEGDQQALMHDEQRRANLKTQKGGFTNSLAAWYDENNFEKDAEAEERAKKLNGQNGQSHRAGLTALIREKESFNQGRRPPFADNYGYTPRNGPSNMGAMPRQGPASRHAFHGHPAPPPRRGPSANAAPDPRSQGTIRIKGGKVVQGSFAQSNAQFASLLAQGPPPTNNRSTSATIAPSPQTVERPAFSSMRVANAPSRTQPPPAKPSDVRSTDSSATRPPPGYNGQAMRSGSIRPPPGFEAQGRPRVPPGFENHPPNNRDHSLNRLNVDVPTPPTPHAPRGSTLQPPPGFSAATQKRPAPPPSPSIASSTSSSSRWARDDPNYEYTQDELRGIALKWAAKPGHERDALVLEYPRRFALLDAARDKLILQALDHLRGSADQNALASYYRAHEDRRWILNKAARTLRLLQQGPSKDIEAFTNSKRENKYFVEVVRSWLVQEKEKSRVTEAKDNPLKSASRSAMAASGATRSVGAPIGAPSAPKKLETAAEAPGSKTSCSTLSTKPTTPAIQPVALQSVLLTDTPRTREAKMNPAAVQEPVAPKPIVLTLTREDIASNELLKPAQQIIPREPLVPIAGNARQMATPKEPNPSTPEELYPFTTTAVHMAASPHGNTVVLFEEPGTVLRDIVRTIVRIPVSAYEKLMSKLDKPTDVHELIQSITNLAVELEKRSPDRVGDAKRCRDGIWEDEEMVEIGIQA